MEKRYDAEVQVTKGCAIPAVVYFIIAVMVYGFTGLMLYRRVARHLAMELTIQMYDFFVK